MGHEKVLAIDDSRDNLTALQAVLRDALPGCVVLTTTSGPHGIELARCEDPDVILLDITMPGMDGFEVCRRMKGEERLQAIPVLFLTALRTDRESRIRALEAGAEGFLSKPLDEQELVAQIRSMSRLKVASRQQHLENERLTLLVAERTRELEQELAERKQTEGTLRESEGIFRRLFTHSPVGVVMVGSDFRFQRCNVAFCRFLGYDESELTGRTFLDVTYPEDRALGIGEIQAILRNELEVTQFQKRYVRKDGVVVWGEVNIRLVREQDGTSLSLLAVVQDITERKQAENALHESEARFQELFERAPLGYQSLDESGYFIEVNQAWLDALGYCREEVIGKWFGDFLAPEFVDGFRQRFPLFKAQGRIHSEFQMLHKDGGRRFISFEGRIGYHPGGAFKQTHCILHDITERKRTEAYREMGLEILQSLNEPGTTQDALQRVLAVLKTRTGFDAVGIRLQDGDDFPYITQQGFSIDFLLTENTLVERGADGGVCRDKDGNVRLECTCGLVISGKTDPSHPLFTRGGSFWTNDSTPLLDLPSDQDPRHHPRNQCIHLGYASVALVPIRDKDRVVGLVHLNDRRKGCFTLESVGFLEGIAAHIGAALMRRQAEEELRRTQAILQAAMDQSTAGIAIADAPSGELRYVNDAGLLIRGGTREAVVNGIGINQYVASWRILDFDGRPLRTDEVPLSRAIMFGETCSREFIIRRADCDDRVVLAKAAPIKDASGRITAGVVVFVDITDNRAAEAEREKLRSQLAQAQKLESVGRLAGGVAHDFNNLLMGIMNYVELCRDEVPSEHPVRGYLDEITRDAQRSADITKQLLAFARKQVIAPKVLDLNDALAAMLKMLRHLMGEDIALNWMPGTHLWPVKIDPGQLDQVLANLCVNARDAIAGVGKVTIESANTSLDKAYCAMHADAVPGDYIRLSVSDSGCGMSKDVLAHMFEPFYTTKEVGKGTGLGLATVHGIVEQNHGHIGVQSEPGKGTTFSIYLPRAASEADTGSAAVTPERLPRGTETIMLAEDETSVRVTSRLFLEALGYTVLAAETPEEALRLAGTHSGPIHLLITDVIMPGMNGPYLAAFLAGERSNLKCLFMSGYTADVMMQRGTLGTDMPFLSKPFSRHDLARKVREVLDGE